MFSKEPTTQARSLKRISDPIRAPTPSFGMTRALLAMTIHSAGDSLNES
jgi:hypothetical protein